MSTKSKTFAEQVNKAKLMIAALRMNLETLKQRGMSEEFIDLLENLINSISEKDIVQERQKADLRATTATIESLLAQLNTQMKEAIKVVKLDVPQPQWKEYGIDDKR
ncbi:MAG: hypothetical protein LBR81_02040 [Prevotellaceae bacterium]|nr:hypothetical protein [Prevotellaceae bacterium]